MRDDEDGKQDSDRAAILARRKRFIALTLSGLATTAFTSGCDKDDAKQDDKAEPRQPEVPPQPCLSVEPLPPEEQTPEEPPPEPPPQPCLKVAAPESDGETGVAEVPPPPPEPDSAPRPCLKKIAPEPRPCLKMAAPSDE